MNIIGMSWNGMDQNMTIHYEILWDSMNHIMIVINLNELNGWQRVYFLYNITGDD